MAFAKTGLASSPQEDTPEDIKTSSETFDTEMTCALTVDDKENSRSRSASPSPDDKMSGKWHLRQRGTGYNTGGFLSNNGSTSQGGFNGAHSNNHGGPLSNTFLGGPSNAGLNNTVPNGTHFNSPQTGMSGPSWRPNGNGYNGQNSGFSPPSNGNGHVNSPYNPHAPMMGSASNRPRQNSVMHILGENSVPLSSVQPGPAYVSDAQLSVAYTYGVRNNDGTVTRVIPADQIQRFLAYPPDRTNDTTGMIVLPPPRCPSPNNRHGTPEQMVSLATIRMLPPTGPDYRVAGLDPTQSVIDHIIASNHPVNWRTAPRREKIYCDKWIHEGVCAFTQMGCKYKHEMPADTATQRALGLNHGFPSWYRRMKARLEAEAAEAARQAGAISDSWRQPLPAPVASSSVGVASLDNGIVYGGQSRNGPGGVSLNGSSLVGNAGSGHGHNGYGPIAPPAPQQALQTPPTDNNRHAPLNTENDADEEDDHIVWAGRRNSSGRRNH